MNADEAVDALIAGDGTAEDVIAALLPARHAVRAHLGAHLRAWRRHSGLTDRDAHHRLGLSGAPSRVHPLEAGEAPWHLAEAKRWPTRSGPAPTTWSGPHRRPPTKITTARRLWRGHG